MYNDHGARNLCLQTGRWTGVDELAHKFWETSPFVSMGNNPIKFVDLDGRETVRPKSETEFNLLRKTLTQEESRRVIMSNGEVKINGDEKGSKNFEYLRTLVKSETTYNIELTKEYQFKDKEGNVQTESFSETGSVGTFKAPGGEKFESGQFKGSADSFANIFINPDAALPGQGNFIDSIVNGTYNSIYIEGEANIVITIGHELYLHAFFYDTFSAGGSLDIYNHGSLGSQKLKMEDVKNEIETESYKNYQSHEK
jgi:hypothetical protein